MNQSTINNVFKKTDESYLKWLFPQNKKSLTTGLVLMFVTVSMISLVDVFYHSDLFGYPTRAAAIAAGGKTFEFDNFFRLIFAPIFNLLTIFLARSAWNNSIKKQEIIVAFVLLVNILSFLFTGIFNDYYTAAQGFTYEVLVLILFCQMLFGISFRVSFFYNLLLVLVTIAYLILDDDPINDFLYSLTMLLLIWISILAGSFKLEQSRLSNFKIISDLQNANEGIIRQENLMKTGESVSKIVSWNLNNDFLKTQYSNGAYDIYEFSESEVKGKNMSMKIFKMIHPDDQPHVEKEVKGLLDGTAADFYEYRIVLPDKRIKWLKCTVGNFIQGEGFYGTVQDVTYNKLLELKLQKTAKELQERNEDLQQFAYASSHDLQEPLRSIANFVTILERKMGNQLNPEYKMYMDIIQNSAGRMKDLINAILDFSRLGKNKKLEEFDCNEVIQNVLIDLNYSIEKAQATFEIDNLPMICGYKSEFSMLLQNLIGNALKFRQKDTLPLIQIMGMELPEHFQFLVQDNGIGMNSKHTKKIFQLFSRLHAQEEYEGTGIGLTHSKKIVEMHGGKIWVDSTPNKGSTFHFTISKKIKQ